jgi:thiamine biosynthesis protein ThiI
MTLEILVRYGELALKSPSVRKQMENKLVKNIRLLFNKYSIQDADVFLKRGWGRIIVSLPENDNLNDLLEKIELILLMYGMGITSFSPATKIKADLEIIKKTALEIGKQKLKPNTTFAVRARRIGTHSFTSVELERLVGEILYESLAKERNLSVNLTQPDYTLFIEVKDDFAFIYDTRVEAYGGLPQGTHGDISAILRGSIEDVLAAFLLAKRGSQIVPILFQVKNKMKNNEALKQQLNYFKFLYPKRTLLFYKINFDTIIEQIGLENLKCSICDELCTKIIYNQICKNQKIDGISLGNSETAINERLLISMYKDISLPIYYPLSVISKDEIQHPFKEKFKSEFCLTSCPGYENEKKKELKSLTQAELEQLVTSVNSSVISSNKI